MEENSVKALEFVGFLHRIEREYSTEIAQWVEEATFMTRWCVQDNGFEL